MLNTKAIEIGNKIHYIPNLAAKAAPSIKLAEV